MAFTRLKSTNLESKTHCFSPKGCFSGDQTTLYQFKRIDADEAVKCRAK